MACDMQEIKNTGVICNTEDTHRYGSVNTHKLDSQTGFFLSRVGNTGIPGVWLFHTGNRYSFDNIVPASIGGLLATPPTGVLGFPLVISFLINVQFKLNFQ